MTITGQTLFAFVDPKDPFMLSEIEGEGQPGPILSMLAAKPFDFLFLFHTPHTRQNASATASESQRRHPKCQVSMHELPVSDPKDYSSLMGHLARVVRSVMRATASTSNYVCVSSGTAEMRTAWFILTATGVLPATMLQIGSPAEPLFGAANVKEVRLQDADWLQLRDLVMPIEYWERPGIQSLSVPSRPGGSDESTGTDLPERPAQSRVVYSRRTRDHWEARISPAAEAEPCLPAGSPLDDALRELNIYVGSAVMQHAAERAGIAAAQNYVPILLTGETGTGKEMFAKLIHRLSARKQREMVCVNCAAIPTELVESTLFGHVKGAFTTAVSNQIGKFELANGSTLFLDEIGELSLEAQAKILRVLEDGVIEPVGASQPKKVDVRVVAATNRNLQAEVSAARFRKDLYFRLAAVSIELPPLRKRGSELPQLVGALLQKINQQYQHPKQLTKDALQRLAQYQWPGNVRELNSVLASSALFAKTGVIDACDLEFPFKLSSSDPFAFLPDPSPGFKVLDFLDQVKHKLVERAIEMSGGNQTAAASLLGLTKQAVSQILKASNDNGA